MNDHPVYGNVLQEQSIENLSEQRDSKQTSKKMKLVLFAGIVVIVLLGILLLMWQNRKSYGARTAEDVTSYFLKALEAQDADEMYRMLSPDYISYMQDAGSIFGMNPKSDVSDQMNYFYEDLRDYYGIGKFKSFSYDDNDIEMIEYGGDDLTEMKEFFAEEFEMDIDAFTQANITLRAEGTKGEDTVSVELFLFRVGKRWYYIDWYWD